MHSLREEENFHLHLPPCPPSPLPPPSLKLTDAEESDKNVRRTKIRRKAIVKIKKGVHV